jgi:hypothetical protein
MDWLILHRGAAEFSLPLSEVDRIVSWSPAMIWIGRGEPAGLVLGDAPPMVVQEPALAAASAGTAALASGATTGRGPDANAPDTVPGAPTQDPRFVVLRDRRNGDCALALLADRVDLAMQARGVPVTNSPPREIP